MITRKQAQEVAALAFDRKDAFGKVTTPIVRFAAQDMTFEVIRDPDGLDLRSKTALTKFLQKNTA